MDITKNEIEKLFPSVYITLMSMLLGFAVEDVVTQLRGLNTIDVYSALSAVGILFAIIACWTGWSFVSLSQERIASVFDGLNVFSLAFCMCGWWRRHRLAGKATFEVICVCFRLRLCKNSAPFFPIMWSFYKVSPTLRQT